MPRKVVVLITLHRRYEQLWANLLALQERWGEFLEKPLVVIVVAQPEPGVLPFLSRLKSDGLIDWVLFRPSNGLDGEATTHPESHNLRLGLSWARDVIPEGYAICQAADITPNPGTYKAVREWMDNGASGCLFHWENGSARENVWHTNFFAISLSDEALWPPLSVPPEADVLERQWGKKLASLGYPGEWWRSHNWNSKHFIHEHLPNTLPSIDSPAPPPAKCRRRKWYKLWLGY